MKPAEVWIRLEPLGPRAVAVWVRLRGQKTLLIREDGTHEITLGWDHFLFNTDTPEQIAKRKIARIS